VGKQRSPRKEKSGESGGFTAIIYAKEKRGVEQTGQRRFPTKGRNEPQSKKPFGKK